MYIIFYKFFLDLSEKNNWGVLDFGLVYVFYDLNGVLKLLLKKKIVCIEMIVLNMCVL